MLIGKPLHHDAGMVYAIERIPILFTGDIRDFFNFSKVVSRLEMLCPSPRAKSLGQMPRDRQLAKPLQCRSARRLARQPPLK